MRQTILTALFLATTLTVASQTGTTVVADVVTRAPIAHASLYTKEQGRFRSCISGTDGRARVAFDFRRLTVSHLNYETATVRRLPDTIFMQPRYRQTQEVVVTNKEPEWIRRKLRQVVKTKGERYFARTDTLHFSYRTQSISQNYLYRYHLAGLMSMKSDQQKRYAFAADTSHITSADTTRLTDTQNLRRMLYEDFVMELDNGFISSHKWGENPDYQGQTKTQVELLFRSKNRTDDRGRVVIDTARCIILEATRQTGTQTNRHERMSGVLYSMAQMMSGYKVTQWSRDYRVRYAQRTDGTLYPRSVGYKMYFANTDGEVTKDQREFSEQTGGGFPNMEATLELSPLRSTFGRMLPKERTDSHLSPLNWESLPPSWYLRLSSDAERQRDVELSRLPATFEIYDDEEEF